MPSIPISMIRCNVITYSDLSHLSESVSPECHTNVDDKHFATFHFQIFFNYFLFSELLFWKVLSEINGKWDKVQPAEIGHQPLSSLPSVPPKGNFRIILYISIIRRPGDIDCEMKPKRGSWLFLLWTLLNFTLISAIDPISTSIAVGMAATLTGILANYKSIFYLFHEGCRPDWIALNRSGRLKVKRAWYQG